jgi:hypothetical protein
MKISKIYNLLFKPFEFISAVVRKDKSYFGIKSPSQEVAKQFSKMSYYFVKGMQEAQVNEVKSKFNPYKIQHGQFAEKYNHIDDIVRKFEWTKREYEDEILN